MRKVLLCEPLSPWRAALAVNSALFLSNAIRKDTIVYVNVEGSVIVIDGSAARRVYPDSESLVGLFKAVKKGKRVAGVSLGDCPEPGEPWCPGSPVRGEAFLIPRRCGLPEEYTLEHELAVLQIELDRAERASPSNRLEGRSSI
ncbi:hypothetical protein [Ignicoccus hospitalis]|uniref:hypothetical protein n=1 Tax=Ignicoccus hospitalis TaxID=160233 RepID=UPI00032247F2|nr:hypothetical protein [Ignicoccus hospitalis]HIH90170.1 hypothetical protein [Desulfurococcaceae archaeon]